MAEKKDRVAALEARLAKFEGELVKAYDAGDKLHERLRVAEARVATLATANARDHGFMQKQFQAICPHKEYSVVLDVPIYWARVAIGTCKVCGFTKRACEETEKKALRSLEKAMRGK